MLAVHEGQSDTPFAVLIPSRGRAAVLAKTLKRQPFLDAPGVYFGVEAKEFPDYACLHRLRHAVVVQYGNPTGSVAVARENLRLALMKDSQHGASQFYTHVVVTDDNAAYTSDALTALVAATRAYARMCGRPVVMAGMHPTAPHFDRHRIAKTKLSVDRFTSYEHVAMIFQCYPMDLYKTYTYPSDAYGLDDRHFFLWAIAHGVRDFRVCMDAPFKKSRYEAGGQGSIEERATKCGLAIARLATDFPQYVGASGTLRIPWQFVLELASVTAATPMTANRLAGGAMRKEGAILKRRVMITKKKR